MPRRSRTAGQTRDVGFQVGARRALAVAPARAWEFLVSPEGATTWLGDTGAAALAAGARLALANGGSAQITVFEPGSHLRMRWQPGGWPRDSIIEVRVIPSGKGDTVACDQEDMSGPAERGQSQQRLKETLIPPGFYRCHNAYNKIASATVTKRQR